MKPCKYVNYYNKVNFLVILEMEQDFSLESFFFIIKNMFVMKNLANFHNTRGSAPV